MNDPEPFAATNHGKHCVDAAAYMNAACERMAEAHWNLTANIPWKEIPEAWKGPERSRMAVAMMAQRKFERDQEPVP